MPSAPKARRWCDVKPKPLLLLLATGLAIGQLSGCQSSGEGAKPVSVLESVAKPAASPATPAAQPAQPAAQPPSDPVVAAVEKVAAVQKNRGTLAALDHVFACYDRVKDPRAPMIEVQACAAQDFVVSKSVEEGKAKPESADKTERAKLIAQRMAPRIGALMQLKGMSQPQFNTFGNYLHRVAKPAYEKAMGT